MSKTLRQITNYLEEKEYAPEFDLDSHTLFLTTSNESGEFQTRFFYDLDMEVLSCQCIFLDSFPKEKFSQMCELINRFNEQLGFGSFVMLEQEDIVFEINYLMEAAHQIPSSVMEKLTLVPQEAMMEHIEAFKSVAFDNLSAEEAFVELFGE